MELLELENLRDALICMSNITQLTAQQRKWLTIVVDIVTNPSIIFMH